MGNLFHVNTSRFKKQGYLFLSWRCAYKRHRDGKAGARHAGGAVAAERNGGDSVCAGGYVPVVIVAAVVACDSVGRHILNACGITVQKEFDAFNVGIRTHVSPHVNRIGADVDHAAVGQGHDVCVGVGIDQSERGHFSVAVVAAVWNDFMEAGAARAIVIGACIEVTAVHVHVPADAAGITEIGGAKVVVGAVGGNVGAGAIGAGVCGAGVVIAAIYGKVKAGSAVAEVVGAGISVIAGECHEIADASLTVIKCAGVAIIAAYWDEKTYIAVAHI